MAPSTAARWSALTRVVRPPRLRALQDGDDGYHRSNGQAEVCQILLDAPQVRVAQLGGVLLKGGVLIGQLRLRGQEE
jgi:hypothetical protein